MRWLLIVALLAACGRGPAMPPCAVSDAERGGETRCKERR